MEAGGERKIMSEGKTPVNQARFREKGSLRETLDLYARMTAVSLRAQMQYRASFFLTTFGLAFTIGTEFFAVWALFARFGTLRGWRLPEVALFYGLIQTAFAFAEGIGRGFDTFDSLVKSGDFDRLLLRPRGTALQVAAREVQLMRVGRLLIGLSVLGWSLASLPLTWSLAKAGLIVLIVVGGACLFYGLLVVQATLAFWTVESLEIMNTVTYGGTETASYPLTIYRPWFRRFFTFVVPLACVNYIPVGALLSERRDIAVGSLWAWSAPLVGVLFLLIALQGWKFGVRHYRSTGS